MKELKERIKELEKEVKSYKLQAKNLRLETCILKLRLQGSSGKYREAKGDRGKVGGREPTKERG